MRQVPKYLVAYTGVGRTSPVVFYEVRNPASYGRLIQFIEQHPNWEVSTEWSKRRFAGFRRERLGQGLPAPAFRETRRGWVRVAASAPQVKGSLEELRYVPSAS